MNKHWNMDWKFLSKVMAIGLPVALQNLLVNASTMFDTMMVGTLGEAEVAAVGLVSQYVALFVYAYFGFTGGGVVFFAQYHGINDEKGISMAYGLVTSCMMGVGLLFGIVAIFFPETVMRIYTDKQDIIQIGIPYLRLIGFSLPLQSLSVAVSYLLRTTERVKAPLVASIISQITNIGINAVLILGLFGFPKMGVTGAAVGTLAASILSVIILYVYCIRIHCSPVLNISQQFKWNLKFVRQYFLKSAPIIANEAMVGVIGLIVNSIMGRQIEEGIAAMAVFRAIERMIYSFFSGFANASAVMVGKQVGAGEHRYAYRDAKWFAILSPAVTCVICILIFCLHGPVLQIFGLTGLSYQYGVYMLGFYIVAGTLRTCNYILNDTFRAGGDTVIGTVTEVGFQMCLTIPLVWLAGIYFKLPFLIVFSLVYIDDILRVWIMLGRLRSGRWIKPVTELGKAALPGFLSEKERKKAGIGSISGGF